VEATTTRGLYRAKQIHQLARVTFPAMDTSDALGHLRQWLDLWRRSLCEPLPCHADLGIAMADEKYHAGKFGALWHDDYNRRGVGLDPYMAWFWPEGPEHDPLYEMIAPLYSRILKPWKPRISAWRWPMSELQVQPLNTAELPLEGRHLIEASAGTGKTFNITRLYLRLLLEKELPVEQILVMTFTRAATAELKGRLGREIQRVHDEWDQLDDDFFAQLRETVPAQKARILLQRALLCLDDAAIYTIHSFCKRALTQQAFASGISFQAELESDTSELMMEALEDWYRIEARGRTSASSTVITRRRRTLAPPGADHQQQ